MIDIDIIMILQLLENIAIHISPDHLSTYKYIINIDKPYLSVSQDLHLPMYGQNFLSLITSRPLDLFCR